MLSQNYYVHLITNNDYWTIPKTSIYSDHDSLVVLQNAIEQLQDETLDRLFERIKTQTKFNILIGA